jgi:hypothetical protein
MRPVTGASPFATDRSLDVPTGVESFPAVGPVAIRAAVDLIVPFPGADVVAPGQTEYEV